MNPKEGERRCTADKTDSTDALFSLIRHCDDLTQELTGFARLQSADRQKVDSALAILHDRLVRLENEFCILGQHLRDEKAALHSAKILIGQVERQTQTVQLMHKYGVSNHHALMTSTFPVLKEDSKRKPGASNSVFSTHHSGGITPVDDVVDLSSRLGSHATKRYKQTEHATHRTINLVNAIEYGRIPSDVKNLLGLEKLNAIITALNYLILKRDPSTNPTQEDSQTPTDVLHEADITQCLHAHPHTPFTVVIAALQSLCRVHPSETNSRLTFRIVAQDPPNQTPMQTPQSIITAAPKK